MPTVNDLRCPLCGREARTGPTYPVHCVCGGRWVRRDPDPPAGEVTPARRGATCAVPLWTDPADARLRWKREDLNRTGSFKDRGAAALAQVAVAAGAERLVLDSSGSAALAGAAAAARVHLPLTVHAPATLPRAKRDALEVMGAALVAEGDRSSAARRAREAAGSAFYFSHVHHPAFHEGTARSGVEVVAAAPEARIWIVPVGNGSLLLGLSLALERAGRDDIHLVAVQAAACPGLRRPGCRGRTAATGIGIADPPRREEILAALERHHGEILEVREEEIAAARTDLGGRGVAAEPGAAAAEAAVRRLRREGRDDLLVAWLTGCGLRG